MACHCRFDHCWSDRKWGAGAWRSNGSGGPRASHGNPKISDFYFYRFVWFSCQYLWLSKSLSIFKCLPFLSLFLCLCYVVNKRQRRFISLGPGVRSSSSQRCQLLGSWLFGPCFVLSGKCLHISATGKGAPRSDFNCNVWRRLDSFVGYNGWPIWLCCSIFLPVYVYGKLLDLDWRLGPSLHLLGRHLLTLGLLHWGNTLAADQPVSDALWLNTPECDLVRHSRRHIDSLFVDPTDQSIMWITGTHGAWILGLQLLHLWLCLCLHRAEHHARDASWNEDPVGLPKSSFWLVVSDKYAWFTPKQTGWWSAVAFMIFLE